MKLITNTQITVDGVMQANGGNNPIFDPGFDRGGWAMALGDEESEAYIGECYQRADAFLFGRRTYELFAGYWGGVRRADVDDPFVSSLNSRPKFVASNTITEPGWSDTTVLSGDVEAAIRELKATPGGELQVHGSDQLIRWLLEHELVDEMTLIVFPVIVGAARGCSPKRARTSPSNCWSRARSRPASWRRPTGRAGVRSMRSPAARSRMALTRIPEV